ncbi:MAG: ribose-5-phosphate isomerase, partial [Rhizobium sp.]
MKLAIAGDSAGNGLAHTLAEYLKDRHEVSEVSKPTDGSDEFYANLSARVAA